jgi:diguanylate cyclase (GGDEF)-like protein/PAS domain S-box-containing protein
MYLLDTRGINFGIAISGILCTLVIFVIWLENRDRFSGLGAWSIGAVLQLAGILALVFRGFAPELISLAVSNALLVGGVILLSVGLQRFLDKPDAKLLKMALWLVFALVYVYFSFVISDSQARSIVVWAALMATCLLLAWPMWRNDDVDLRPTTRGIGAAIAVLGVLVLIRIVVVLFFPSSNAWLVSNTYDTEPAIACQALVVLLTLGLIMGTNQRLSGELERESLHRRQADFVLEERVKQLKCIYDLSQLVETPGISLDEILSGSVGLLTAAMQYPDLACARLTLDDRSFTTESYRHPIRNLSQEITFDGRKVGALEVGYLKRSYETEAPQFLEGENNLLLILAERLGRIIQRKRTEAALRESEERFHKAFQSSPDAILISRQDDGRLIEVNDGFCRLTGYAREEALSRTSVDLGLWNDPQDRERVAASLRQGQRIREQEFVFRSKSGEVINGLYSGEIIFLGTEAHVLSVVRDVSEQKRAEEALRQSEQKFRGVIEQSWDGITVADEQGLIVEWNRGMERITGFQAADAIGKPVWDIQFWASPREADKQGRYERTKATIMELIKSGQAPWLERLVDNEFEYPDGRRRFIQSAVFPIRSERGFMICSVVRDVTERKRAEELTRLRLILWEYAATHPLEELMRKALDEIGALTSSPIGFYHFVEEDQKRLSLQAWSTRTLQEFCQAEGEGLHYDIEDAGVWVEAFYKRKPVIHNDYASMPGRKGLPEGHAEVTRELVVPVIRDGRVVSILGVGNKRSAYDENDVELVSNIADIIWAIIERKRAEEQIHQLNARLEILAMTDSLTGALNRRSFLRRGEEEFMRFSRYQTPFSLLMLDIDGFKRINDTFGHDVGDKTLRCFVEILQQNIRKTDLLARLGGEEFGILLSNTGAMEASVAAGKLRQAIESRACTIEGGQTVGVTVSIGVASANHRVVDFGTILKNADVALYRAKNKGRNKVIQYEEEN